MKRLITSLLMLLTLTFSVGMFTQPALAWSPFGGVDCGGNRTNSAVCSDAKGKDDPISGANGLILKITNIVAVIAGVAAVVIIILAGLRFIQSGGSSEDIAGARRSIIYASVGLVVIVLARALIGLILSTI